MRKNNWNGKGCSGNLGLKSSLRRTMLLKGQKGKTQKALFDG